MDSLQIHINVQGQDISFDYHQREMKKGAWAATIKDECGTVEEILLGNSPDKCLEELVPFLNLLGNVIEISSSEKGNPYIAELQNKLKLYN